VLGVAEGADEVLNQAFWSLGVLADVGVVGVFAGDEEPSGAIPFPHSGRPDDRALLAVLGDGKLPRMERLGPELGGPVEQVDVTLGWAPPAWCRG